MVETHVGPPCLEISVDSTHQVFSNNNRPHTNSNTILDDLESIVASNSSDVSVL